MANYRTEAEAEGVKYKHNQIRRYSDKQTKEEKMLAEMGIFSCRI